MTQVRCGPWATFLGMLSRKRMKNLYHVPKCPKAILKEVLNLQPFEKSWWILDLWMIIVFKIV
jgi:hypothetical protein